MPSYSTARRADLRAVRPQASAAEPVVITDARMARSDDIEMRQRRYAISMAIRTICFVLMFFASGPWRWVCLAGAAFIPGIAVVLANARDNHSHPTDPRHLDLDEPPLPMLGTGPIIRGDVVDDHEE